MHRRAECHRCRDDTVTLRHAERGECNVERRGARVQSQGSGSADELGELLLECARLWTRRQPPGAEGLDDGCDLFFAHGRWRESDRRWTVQLLHLPGILFLGG